MNPFETPDLSPPSRPNAAAAAVVVAGAKGLLILQCIELGWYVLNTLYNQVFMRLASSLDYFELYGKVTSLVWLLFAGATIVLLLPFIQGRRGTNAAGVAMAALVLTAISVLPNLVSMVKTFGGPELLRFGFDTVIARLLYVFEYGVFIGIEVCFWLAITRSTTRLPSAYNAIFYLLLALSVLLALPRLVLPMDQYADLHRSGLSAVMNVLRIASGIGRPILIILVLRMLVRGEGAEGSAPAETTPEEDVAAARTRDFVVGGLWLGGGLLVTVVSYAIASEGGGRYLVTTGAIIYGAIRLIRGLTR